MRSALAAAAHRRAAGRARSNSLSAIPPPEDSDEYLPELAAIAASILYRSPLLSSAGRPVYILNAAAFPDAFEVDYDSLLSYVLARLPGEDELISGTEYEVVFFAGGQPDNATADKKQGPSTGWYLQAYHVLSRAMRKKLQMLYIVHPRTWVRVLISIFGTIVSPKFRRKIVHVNSISSLALYIPIEKLLIPPSAYMQDRKVSADIYAPYVTGKRAFGVRHPLPKNITTKETRLPRVLRETSSFLLMPQNITTEGIFRIPPSSILAGVLKEAYDRGQQFIVWKEGEAVLAPPGIDNTTVDEIRVEDTYGVHLAASLIKNWYRDLREPIFPESCYPQLQARYADRNKITPEDLVDIVLPASQTSPLTQTARQILIRHLLPLLSSVALHADQNKMTPENLAIVFSMCLVRGSDHLQDSKISATVRKILTEAIEEWPELQTGLSIDNASFETDLRPPADSSSYEDPLDDDVPPQHVGDDTGNKITLNDSSNARTSPSRAPTLPARRSRAASLKAALAAPQHVIDALPSLPKRKPALPIHDIATKPEESHAEQPPRYSTVFDADGQSIHMADSPITVTPANGFGPPRRADFSYDETDRGNTSPFMASEKEAPQQKGSPSPTQMQAEFGPGDHQVKPNGLLAQLTTRQTISRSSSQSAESSPTVSETTISTNQKMPVRTSTQRSDESSVTNSAIHRKPFVKPAITTGTRQPADIHSLARPVIPIQHAHTIPIVRHNGAPGLSAPPVPKPRTPSPGLLKRMTSIENVRHPAEGSTGPSRLTLEPRKMNLRKTSVDDLRRLYEDRVDTAKNLVAAANAPEQA